jgi:hypothetical protein
VLIHPVNAKFVDLPLDRNLCLIYEQLEASCGAQGPQVAESPRRQVRHTESRRYALSCVRNISAYHS